MGKKAISQTLDEKIKRYFPEGYVRPLTPEEKRNYTLLRDLEDRDVIEPWMSQFVTEVMLRGKTIEKAAEVVGIDVLRAKTFWFDSILCKKLIQDALSNTNLKNVRLRLKASTDIALDTLFAIMNDVGDGSTQTKALRARIAMEILTQAGVPEAKEFKFKVEHEYKNLIKVIEEVSNDFEKPKEIEYEEAKLEESGEQGNQSREETSSGNAEVSTPSKSPHSFDVTKQMIREVTV